MRDIAVVDFATFPIAQGSYPPEPVGVAIAAPDAPPKYWSWGHPWGNNCDRAAAQRRLREVYQRFAVLCHGAAFDLLVGTEHLDLAIPDEYHCTLTLAFLLNPYAPDLRLKEYYETKYGVPPTEHTKLFEWIREHIPGASHKDELGAFICRAPGDMVAPYAIRNTSRPRRLFKDLYRQVEKLEMLGAYRRELKQIPVIADMTHTGVPVNRPRLERDIGIWSTEFERIEAAVRRRLKAPGLDIDKAAQLVPALEKAGVMDDDLWALTPSGQPATSYDVLKVACKDKNLLRLLERRGMLKTSLNTFMRRWLEFSARDGRLHISWNPTRRPGRDGKSVGARTGRWSATPNLQNVPGVETAAAAELPNVRSYLVPPRGAIWIQRDYRQQEFRIAGHYEAQTLQESYRENDELVRIPDSFENQPPRQPSDCTKTGLQGFSLTSR